jgi:plastocyanin
MRQAILKFLRPDRLGLTVLFLVALPALAADLSVSQKNRTFSTPSLTVHVGDTVHFENFDDVTHNITVKDAEDDTADLGLQKPGVEVSHRFDAKGRYRVVCSIHPRMRMTVNVQ